MNVYEMKKKGSEKMVDNGITITIDKFAELTRKEVAYDMKVREVEADLKEGRYVDDFDKMLFVRNPLKEGEE